MIGTSVMKELNNFTNKRRYNLTPIRSSFVCLVAIRFVGHYKVFKQCFETGVFRQCRRKGNTVPIRKNGEKQSLKNIALFHFLLTYGNIQQKFIFNKKFRFFLENKLISLNQSDLKPGDSCINQFSSVAHDICQFLDESFEVCDVSCINQGCHCVKKGPYSELFCSVFSCLRTEYEQMLCISLYSVRMRGNADQNNSEYGYFSCSVLDKVWHRGIIFMLQAK